MYIDASSNMHVCSITTFRACSVVMPSSLVSTLKIRHHTDKEFIAQVMANQLSLPETKADGAASFDVNISSASSAKCHAALQGVLLV